MKPLSWNKRANLVADEILEITDQKMGRYVVCQARIGGDRGSRQLIVGGGWAGNKKPARHAAVIKILTEIYGEPTIHWGFNYQFLTGHNIAIDISISEPPNDYISFSDLL